MPIPVLTAREMANVDARAIQEYGIPSACLMETAGAQCARAILERYDGPRLRVLVVCGKGNNGGDGFVVARHLLNAGARVEVAVLFSPGEAQGDPAIFLDVLEKMGVSPLEVEEEKLSSLGAMAEAADLVVDAVLGTGFRPPARGLVGEAIRVLADCPTPVAAIDVPSGLDPTTGAAQPPHLKADLTLALGARKRGHLLMPAAAHVGEVVPLDIGIPAQCLAEEGVALHVTEPSDVAANLPGRPPDAHKGDAGHLLVIAGAPGMGGAALLTAMAGLRAGAGRVTLGVPAGMQPLLEGRYPEIMTLALPATESGALDGAAFDLIVERAEAMNALVVGPGLGTNPRTVEFVHRLIQHVAAPIVLDADGLNALSQDLTILSGGAARLVLTPHPGEMARLLGVEVREVQEDRVGHASRFAAHHQLELALKGWGTIVATSGGEAWYNPTGSSDMATAGSGDVLAGVVGALCAQGLSGKWALVCGAYLHGLAGEAASAKAGGLGITARDIVRALPAGRRKALMDAGDAGGS